MITSRQNARVKALHQARRCRGPLALLEGPHLVREALAAGLDLDTVLATPAFVAESADRALLAALPAPPLELAPELLAAVCDSTTPRGIVALVRLPRRGVETLEAHAGGVYLFADAIQDPGNLGALARVAEASGATGLALGTGCAHPNHPRALRASAGSLLRLPTAWRVAPEALDRRLAPAAPRWAVLVPRGGEDLYRATLTGTLILAVGAEGPGVSPALADRAELALTIPLASPVESLNVTVAAAVVLFELRRRRGEA